MTQAYEPGLTSGFRNSLKSRCKHIIEHEISYPSDTELQDTLRQFQQELNLKVPADLG